MHQIDDIKGFIKINSDFCDLTYADTICTTKASHLEIGNIQITDEKIILKDKEIELNNILTIDEIINTENLDNGYKIIFKMLCKMDKNDAETYNALLKLYGNNYRYAVLAIENKKAKSEIKKLNESFE